MRRFGWLLLMLVAASGLVWHFRFEPARLSRRLAGSLPTLSQLQVRVFRNQDWCRCFDYRRGKFMDSSHPSTCPLFQGQAAPYDVQARADHDRVARAVGGDALWVLVEYDGSGRITRAEFALAGAGRRSLVYEPGYSLPPDQGSEIRYRAVDPDWYLQDEDWN